MRRIAYTIAGAASAASVTEEIIVRAVKQHELIARCIEGERAVILDSDIQVWLEGKPNYLT